MPKIIPNHKIILLIRDPRDNAISIMNKNFGPCEISYASHYVRQRMDPYIAAADNAATEATFVKYEDLLSNPIACVKNLEGFVEATVTADVERKINELKIKKDNKQKWRKLNSRDLAASEAVFSDLISRFGYQSESNSDWTPSVLDRFTRNIKDKSLRIPQKLRVKSRRYLRG